MARLSFFFLLALVTFLVLTEGRPSNVKGADDEEYVSREIVKKGDISKKEDPAAKKTGKLVLLQLKVCYLV